MILNGLHLFDALRKMPVRASGQVHHRHAAAPQFPFHPSGARHGIFGKLTGQDPACSVLNGVLNLESAGVVAQKRKNLVPEFVVPLRLLLDQPSLLIRRQLGGRCEKVLHLYPSLLAKGISQRATLL
jgi:hypothetical protein